MSIIGNLKHVAKQINPEFILLAQIRLGNLDNSYAEEFSTFNTLLRDHNIDDFDSFIDFGAGDGFSKSISWPIAHFYSANGLLVEPEVKSLIFARRIYKTFPKIKFCNKFATPQNVNQIIAESGLRTPFYIKIDIDSYDLELMRSILLSGIKPKVISIEINELIPPPIIFEKKWKEGPFTFKPPLYGCSLQAAADLAQFHGYYLYKLAYNNAFFVSEDLKVDNVNNKVSVAAHYRYGFLEANWQRYFPWHIPNKSWFSENPQFIVDSLRKLPDFSEREMTLFL